MSKTLRSILVALLFVLLAVVPAIAEDSLATARQLYADAAYDEALAMLDRLRGTPGAAASEVEQERALCLLALNRTAEAEDAMAAVVQANPMYVPDESAVSPRVRATFQDVRARLIPDLARATFARARSSYDAGDHARALADLEVVLALTNDPAAAPSAKDEIDGLRLLAEGFRTLSEAAVKAAQDTQDTKETQEMQAAAEPSPAPPEEAAAIGRVFDASVPGVVPPVIVKQDVPQWRSLMGSPPSTPGLIAVTIDEEGAVERLDIIRSLHPSFDVLLRAAVEKWSYVPATYDGTRVKFRKSIRLALR